jgi:hypothetical protein
VKAEGRLAEIVTALGELELRCLVMGGHAVRYYGVERNTLDYDLHLSMPSFADLGARLRRSPTLASLIENEGPSWRPGCFRRFTVGRLPDGREERLEFWRANHLLPPFDAAYARREEGRYGEALLPFLGLADLIRSKETERESDWQDVRLLEEILDARNLARARERSDYRTVLAQLRSRRGFERALAQGLLADAETVSAAYSVAENPITRAYLRPCAEAATPAIQQTDTVTGVLEGPLRQAVPGSPRHLALVEAIRRLYKQACLAADRADKADAITLDPATPRAGA